MISKLIDKIVATNAPIVVGLDPKLDFVPEAMKKRCFEEKGENLEGAAEAFWQFNKEIIDHIYDIVPAVKPQIAMYEELGIPGLITFKKTVEYCKEKGLIVIGDIKRGDIGSTSESYAVGHLGYVKIGEKTFRGFEEDFATVNPYLGSDGVKPFIDVAKRDGKGIFCLVRTSNPSAGDFQDQELADGKKLYEIVAGKVSVWGEELIGEEGFSSVGAVVGATWPEQAVELRKLMPRTFMLIPGYGAQGAGADAAVAGFTADGKGGIVNSSRAIMTAWKARGMDPKDFGKAARLEALDMKENLNGALKNRKYV